MVSTAFLVMMVLKSTKTRFLPDYVRTILVAGAYFVATASTQQFSEGGNNFAKSFATVILSGEYLMILWFLMTSIIGFVLGFSMFRLLHSSDKRASRLDLDSRDIMEREEKRLGDSRVESQKNSRVDESELKEEKRPLEI